MLGKLRSFDAYVKGIEGVTQKTLSGGVVTVATAAVIVLLFLSELSVFASTELVSHMALDPSQGKEVRISLDLEFPHIPCEGMSLDVEDFKGEQQAEAANNVNYAPVAAAAKDETDGCRLRGVITVPRVAGNFHVALGKSVKTGGNHHAHQFSYNDVLKYNTSHTVHELSFGPRFPKMTNPLTGVTNVLDKGTAQYQYFIKVVPSTYVYGRGRRVESNQYSVTEHKTVVDLTSGQMPHPGVFFKYSFSPVLVSYKEEGESFFHFVTSLFAIIGGTFTVASLVDSFIYKGAQALKKAD